MSSHLPDAIKKMMIDNPIPDPIPTPNLSEEFINNVSKKMNSKEYSVDNMRNNSNSNVISENNVKVKSKDPIPELPNLNNYSKLTYNYRFTNYMTGCISHLY
mgnify:CR=1 FL=1